MGLTIKDTNYPIPTSKVYFVSPTGNDTSSGAKDSPWRTIGKAIASASKTEAATIVLRGGTYREGDLTLDRKLTLQPYPHEKVWIKGSIVVTDWVADGSIWRKDNWNYQFPPNDKPENIDPDYPMSVHRDMVFVDGNALEQVSSKDKASPGKFYVDYANKKLYIGNNPAGKTVEATAFEQFLKNWAKAAGSVIRGLGFVHYAEAGLFITQPMTFENNTFAWNGIRGLIMYGTNSAVIRGNTFSYNGRNGLRVHDAKGTLVEKNTFSYNNNFEHFATNFDAAGVKFTQTDNLILRDNVAEQNLGHGFWLDVSSTNATIVRNVAKYNRDGIFFEKCHNTIIASNIACCNNRNGISIFESSNAKIYNNTLSENPVNLNVGEGDRENTDSQEIAAGITWNTANVVVKNNIFSNSKGTKDGDGNVSQVALLNVDNKNRPQSDNMVTGLDYNAYYRTAPGAPNFLIKYKPHPEMDGPEVNFRGFADFRAKYPGFENNALVIDGVATNPFFTDEANGNYQPKSGSPAIKAGAPLPEDVASAIGVQSGVPVSLGALHL